MDKYWQEGDTRGVWMGYHGHSWVTLAELEAYPWDAPLHRGGVVHKDIQVAAGERPSEWSGAVWGKSADDYRRHEWTEPISYAVGAFYTVALPWLRTLGKPEDVRLVFGFDS